MRGIRTPSTDCSSAEPSPIFPYRPPPKATKRSPGLHRKSHTRELTDAMARHRSLQPIARIIVAVAPFMCMIATAALFEIERVRTNRVASCIHRSVRQIRRGGLRSLRPAGPLDLRRSPS